MVRSEPPLNGKQIVEVTERVLKSESFNECSKDFCDQLLEFMKSTADQVDKTREKYDLNNSDVKKPEGKKKL